MELRYNEPRYNEDPVITKNIWKPGRITVQCVETNPAITNRFWRSQRTIYLYPAVTNILYGRSQQSVKKDRFEQKSQLALIESVFEFDVLIVSALHSYSLQYQMNKNNVFYVQY